MRIRSHVRRLLPTAICVIAGAALLPAADLLFFGSAHFTSTATEANVIHTGIYLGDNWVIHSSGQGVYVLPLKGGWLGDQFAWGRRVLP
jgi:cell wall-associated NlpC family hydrolase